MQQIRKNKQQLFHIKSKKQPDRLNDDKTACPVLFLYAYIFRLSSPPFCNSKHSFNFQIQNLALFLKASFQVCTVRPSWFQILGTYKKTVYIRDMILLNN